MKSGRVSGKKSRAAKLRQEIRGIAAAIGRPVKLMTVCGTHAQSIARHGIESALPGSVKLVSGPGCPVCVTPQRGIDEAVQLALSGVQVFTYGDILRVPGSAMSLEQARARGADVRVVYSITEALEQASDNSVFFAIGFETTAPMTAVALTEGLTVLSAHKLIPPAMKALVSDPSVKVEGFINPGHVSTVIGSRPYRIVKAPQVITGFEPLDVLEGITMLLKQIRDNRSEVEIQYRRSVRLGGNSQALEHIVKAFSVVDSEWRGLGVIPLSGLEPREKYDEQNARLKYEDLLANMPESKEPAGCRCGDVLKGIIEPRKCPLFGEACTPDTPKGACMVSSEGACGIAYTYGG